MACELWSPFSVVERETGQKKVENAKKATRKWAKSQKLDAKRAMARHRLTDNFDSFKAWSEGRDGRERDTQRKSVLERNTRRNGMARDGSRRRLEEMAAGSRQRRMDGGGCGVPMP